MLFLTLTTVLCGDSFAQKYSINAYGGYTLDDGIRYSGVSNEYSYLLKGGFIYGAGFEYVPHRSNFGVELLYMGQNTEATPETSDTSAKAVDVGINYLMLGPNAYFQHGRSETFYSFAGAMIGLSYTNSENPVSGYSQTKTNFAWGMRIGGKFFPSENISLNIIAQLIGSTQSVDNQHFSNSQVQQDGSASIIQFGMVGGISYVFGD